MFFYHLPLEYIFFQITFQNKSVFRAIFGYTGLCKIKLSEIAAYFWPDFYIHPQDEETLLVAVEESQNKLLELQNQLLSKKSEVVTAKAELDQKTQTVQEINR